MMPLPTDIQTLGPGHFQFRLEPGHHVFQGHFPGDPIVPGLAQVAWAVRLGEQAFGPLGAFSGLTNLKFQRVITPGELVVLRLRHLPAKRALAFEFCVGEERKSSGTLTFREQP